MKIQFYHHGSDMVIGDTIERLPILDWNFHYKAKSFVYSSAARAARRMASNTGKAHGLTGEYYSWICINIVLFRRMYVVTLEWNHGKMDADAAFAEYKNKIKESL